MTRSELSRPRRLAARLGVFLTFFVFFAFLAPSAFVNSAAAQGELPPPLFEGEDELPPPEFADDGELPPPEFGDESESAASEEGEPPGTVSEDPADWQIPKIMVVAHPRTPRTLRRELNELAATIGQLEDEAAYVREARSRGFPPTSAEALEVLLPEMDVALVLVVQVIREGDSRFLSVEYRDGRIGFALLEEVHGLAGNSLRDEARERMRAEARLALAAITRPPGAPPPANLPVPEVIAAGPPPEPGAAVHVFIGAGFGFGMRRFEMPTSLGIVRLSTDPFPAISLGLGLDYEPEARGRLSVRGELSYLTSVGLEVTDNRTDGSSLTTPARSQRFDVRLGALYRIASGPTGVALGGALGFGLRAFDAEAAVTLPDYSLSGFSLRLSLVLPLLEGRLQIRVDPEVEWIAFVDDGLTQAGIGSSAVSVGAEARLLFQIAGPFHAEVLYRESHVFLDSSAGDAGDVERYGTLGIVYRP
ncbi:MAG: hypothetical protein JRH11_10910 [Deltaproteobacteria bacterium]|nr:hypothetical protein [Deltaproteobacteria bacterium]